MKGCVNDLISIINKIANPDYTTTEEEDRQSLIQQAQKIKERVNSFFDMQTPNIKDVVNR